ncbi:MAG: cysteine desulfurase-like protein [Chloroflexota bacterium]|nr:cysteine desulfurase-like protein [Chloroflexota bacterium]
MTAFDVEALRRRFPALSLTHGGHPMAFFDGPGGTQVPDTVIDAVSGYYRESNANAGGPFPTSIRSDAIADEAHAAAADLFGAADPAEITFGANMTSLTLHVSRSLGATMAPGDEIVVTDLDHEANVGPWNSLAADRGLTVRSVAIRRDDVTLDLGDLDRLLGSKTRLVAVGWASNAVGSINPIREIARLAHAVGALVYVDAVHWAPHGPIDVREADADLVVCSAYKFFGPHAGVLYGRREVLERLPTYKIRPAHHRFETGTMNFEGLAGTLAAIEYIADVGRRYGGVGAAADRRAAIVAGMSAIRAYEIGLFGRLVDGLEAIPGLRLYGIADRARFADRTPTAAVRFDGISPEAVSVALGEEGIATWHGDFYATGLIERLGLLDSGGVLRIGLTHYNTAAEVDRLLGSLRRIVARSVPAASAS